MPDENLSQPDALRQHIATLEAQLAALRQQLGHGESVSQSGAGAIATSGRDRCWCGEVRRWGRCRRPCRGRWQWGHHCHW